MCVFFILTDRASTIPSNTYGCQSGTVRGLLDRKIIEEQANRNPFKCHEEVLSLQPMIPPKRFDIFPPDWGMLRSVQIFRLTTKKDKNKWQKKQKMQERIGNTVGCRDAQGDHKVQQMHDASSYSTVCDCM